ncbi:putative NRPS-like protein biosynthetic cluster [Steccherinum ochraceum]|uniref:Putative NRPS-like protein biosynthetic cluster n=1 Tax=Steccherinum ochraceum TaxID=92696 RepID=A0A4R0RGU7_9APHY|nr:putative NRPS-like protein biosynthetic cluster [Steccherinum ochraceum]
MSPRNSPDAVCEMLHKTSCKRIIAQQSLSALVSAVQTLMVEKNSSVEVVQLPFLHDIFPTISGEDVVVEPYPRTSRTPQPDDVVLILHSSGSTGFPKPIPQTNQTILEWCLTPIIYRSRDKNICWGGTSLPTFHTMGIYIQFYAPLTSGEFIGLFTPQYPAPPVVPNPQNTLATTKLVGCNGIVIMPSYVEEWAQSPENAKYLTSLDVLVFAGGPLSDANGDKLVASGVNLCSIYGATEFGAPTMIFDTDDTQGPDSDVKTSADWAWLQLSNTVNTRWVPQGDGTYELQTLTCATHHPAVKNLSDVEGYATSDLFRPHPRKKGLWKIVGRTDDVIVLGAGEKIVPIPQEGYLSSLPFVKGVTMFGRGQTQAGVLIEPAPDAAIDPTDETALETFRERIWPFVEEANKLAPAFARIFKEMILVTHPAKPMARVAKGTVMRKLVLAEYDEEIQRLAPTNKVAPPSEWTAEVIEEWLLQQAMTINKGQEPSAVVDIFEQGFDSLSASFLHNHLIGALHSSSDPAAQAIADKIPQDFIFTHPTLQRLAGVVAHLVHPDSSSELPRSQEEQIAHLVEKYTVDLPNFTSASTNGSLDGAVVLLTGSTGSLGSHILAYLLQSSDVRRVYTLDRGSGSLERLKASFVDRSLPIELLQSDKLVACSGVLSRVDLGLDPAIVQEIQRSVTHIIHNAWKLDFNLSVSSFESHIAGTRTLVDFSAGCTVPVKFLFSSSVTSAQSWNAAEALVPEHVLTNPRIAVGHGYGESKYVVERLLADAKSRGLDTLSLRIGQLSGSTHTGAWNVSDWVPIIVKSSVALGCLPDLDGTVDWTPVDVAARTIVDAVATPGSLPDVINIVHPRPATWSAIFSSVNESVGGTLQLIPFDAWLVRVEARSATATEHDFDRIPAIKLLRFLRSFVAPTKDLVGARGAGEQPLYDCSRAQAISPTLKDAEPIGANGVGMWLKYWATKEPSGFCLDRDL